ncbi:MAG TPA: PDZ domain-containing protein [Thermoanaerobaculia bacterium]|jgi:tricorn protease|nr:PDZ domain-containing protein [Thermoanaerobaculia bacterium]
MKKIISVLILLATAAMADAQENLTRLLRQPDIAGDKIAFVYGGDIWVVSATGGEARRLTSDDGVELFPKFSPDGKWIAYCGEYGGNRQVYVISAEGGQPRQLTFYNDIGNNIPPRGGVDNRVVDWSPDGKNILFLPHRLPWSDRMPRPYVIPVAGGMETPLAIPEGSGGSYSPDGTKLVYTPIEREFRTWKRYRGGRAQDVWIYDLQTNKAEQLTNDKATDNQPMWVGNTIYFTSDREGGKLNLYSYDLATRQTRKVTTHKEWDVLWPSSDQTQVVYENAGYIWRYDTKSGRDERVPIRVFGDFKNTVPQFSNVKEGIESWDVSPTGARGVFTARGDVFTVPAKNGEVRNLTQTPGVREMDASWSPDGKWIAYLSDRTGEEYEIYVRPADGSGEERRITSNGKSWRFPPRWSPDSRSLAYSDKDHDLHIVDVASGKLTSVDHGDYGDINWYRWSPDSKWLTYSKNNQVRFSVIYVYNTADGKASALTSGMTDDNEPTFDPKGRYLYFNSNRDFNLTFSAFEFNYVYTNPLRVYVGVLANDGPALFLPQSDEEKGAAEKTASSTPAAPTPAPAAADDKEKKDEKKPAAVNVKIDVAGFEQRVRAIPGPSGNYRNLNATPNGVLYIAGDQGKTSLRFYNLEDRKEETILEGARAYELSADGTKVLARTGNDYTIVPVKPGQKAGDGTLNLDRMEMKIDPREEWAQEFTDAWRILRDWFYDPNMHGVNWAAIRARYGELVPYISHRSDLDYILGEIAGEVNSGHVYVETTDDWKVKRVEHGLLGAEIVSDPSGYFRVRKIYPGENWHESFRSPFTEPGVKVKEGDYILSVDGVPTRGVDNFYRLMENKAGRVVALLVNSSASTAGAHEERVRPIAKETNVRYLDWVRSRRELVDRLSGGRIGYIHLPNTGAEGNRELFKFFYPQVDKDALIIDDRYNGGGFIPDRMIELLDRPLLNYWVRRGEKPSMTPAYGHQGPKAMLINGYSASGGDALPYYFRKRQLGTLIGTRTWGGLIGLSGNPGLMDGGSIEVPQFRFLDAQGMWAIEGTGVTPDIEVVDRPDLVVAGHDPSLEKAVEVLLQQLREHPPVPVTVPPAPSIP